MVGKMRLFSYKRFMQATLIIFFYAFVLIYYASPYTLDLIPQINVRFIFSHITDMFTFSMLINATLVAHTIHFFTKLLVSFSNMGFSDFILEKLTKINQIKIIFKLGFDDLDVSNPFLYADKTCALLE